MILDDASHLGAPGMPEHQAAADFLVDAEQAEFLAQFPVIPLLGLFDHRQMGLEPLLIRKRSAVNTGEHFVFFVSPPVGAGRGEQLERLEGARVGQVGARAKIHPFTVLVQGDGLVRVDPVQNLELVGFPHLFEQATGLVPSHHLPFKGQLLRDDFVHLLFDGDQVLPLKVPSGRSKS